MTDRELLELAAMAAGITVVRSRLDDPTTRDMLIEDSPRNIGQRAGPWNPLTDDGDALRLAVKVKIHPETYTRYSVAKYVDPLLDEWIWTPEEFCDDPYAATRRAIVRAAAEIGRSITP